MPTKKAEKPKIKPIQKPVFSFQIFIKGKSFDETTIEWKMEKGGVNFSGELTGNADAFTPEFVLKKALKASS